MFVLPVTNPVISLRIVLCERQVAAAVVSADQQLKRTAAMPVATAGAAVTVEAVTVEAVTAGVGVAAEVEAVAALGVVDTEAVDMTMHLQPVVGAGVAFVTDAVNRVRVELASTCVHMCLCVCV